VYPEDLLYTKNHEWVKVEDDRAIVGVTSYAQDQLVEVVFVELPEEGKEVKAGDTVATLESVKAVADVYAPVSGKIIEVNKQLENQPELVNQDPYGEGWILVIEIAGEEELHTLMKVSDYQSLIENELKP
jgi:glycine cleavage system H protein